MGVVTDVFTYLEAQGVAGGSTEWALLRRRVMDQEVTDQLVVVTEDGGGAPEIAESPGIGDSALKDLGVQVLVRGNPWDGDSSLTKAVEVFDTLHGLLDTLVGATTYLRVKAQTGEPVFVGFDERGRPQHTLSFLLLASV